jgi:hypothetical protein
MSQPIEVTVEVPPPVETVEPSSDVVEGVELSTLIELTERVTRTEIAINELQGAVVVAESTAETAQQEVEVAQATAESAGDIAIEALEIADAAGDLAEEIAVETPEEEVTEVPEPDVSPVKKHWMFRDWSDWRNPS